MTPKEKAIQLVNKYLCVDDYYKRDSGCRISQYEAKQCAIIAVDEIIELIEKSYYDENIIKGAKLYWNGIKQEIKNI